MINPKHLDKIDSDFERFITSEPFNYIVIDNFIEDSSMMRLISEEVKTIPNSDYDFNEHAEVQINKRGLSLMSKFPTLTKKLIEYFQSPEMVQYLENLTGIRGLLPDPSLLGGGLHKMDAGGHLAIHADFNIHIHSGHWRRVNALLYLNEEWIEEWGGHLELWTKDMTNCFAKITPILNRLVVFRITDDAFHGHPEKLRTPDDISRYSLAFYYYTEDRPDIEKQPFHWALWQRRPDGNF